MVTSARLLVLSVGTQVGQNVLTTLAGRRAALKLVATSTVAHEPAVFDYDVVYLAPPTAAEPQAFGELVLDIMAREHIDLVVPCRDDDVLFLAALRDRRPELAPRLLCGSEAAAQVIVDKWRSAEFCTQHGLPFAASIRRGAAEERAEFVRRHGYPLVAKPRRGYASQDVYLIFNDRQFDHAIAQDGVIVQQFLGERGVIKDYLAGIDTRGVPLYHTFQGLKHSIQALIGPGGDVVHVICTRNRNERRRSKWVEPDSDGEAMQLGERCAQAFSTRGWRGPLNIQCQKTPDGALKIHEFNGRFTGATVDRWLLGYDEVGTAIARFTGLNLSPAQPPKATATEAFEALVARAADPAHVHSLVQDRVWRRAP